MSIHVVDVSRGVVTAGMAIEVAFVPESGPRHILASGSISAKGTFDHPALTVTLEPGRYQAVFQVGAYYRAAKLTLPDVPFLDVVTYDFGIADPRQHYHLPFKCTPWGYSCFRGGA
jgi:5-hydroxyisourate hydrolase